MIEAAFERQGIKAKVVATSGDRVRYLARALREEGFDRIAAGGGDGTVSAVAAEMIGHKTALGVLPVGTLNHFARDLGIPIDIDRAVALVCAGEPTRVDVGSVNGITFINNSSLGLYPDQVRVRKVWRDRIGKWPAMFIASIIVLTRFPYLRVKVEFDDKRIRRRCAMVLVSNNEYKLEPGNLTERERVDRGQLGVYLLKDEGRLGLIRIALHSLVFRPEEATSFEAHSATEIVVTTRRRRVRVALDGEVYRLASPLRYSTIPGGLRVIAPPKQ